MHPLLPLIARREPPRRGSVQRSAAGPSLALTVALLAATTARAEEVPRHIPDRDDLMWMRKRHPEAAQKFEQGESIFAAARSPAEVERALSLLTEAALGAPESSLAFRRKCQALTALGRHGPAIKACDNAVYDNSTIFAIRALVGAYMSGNEPPTPSELGYAKLFARRVRETSPDTPWGWAAQCDIALKLGDTDMLNECADHLKKSGPDLYETKRIEAIEATIRPGWGTVAGWASLAVLTLFTVVHAAIRGAHRFRLRARSVGRAGALVAVAGLALAQGARAAEKPGPADEPDNRPPPGAFSKFAIDDADPRSSVPSAEERDKDPLQYGYFLMDLNARARAALKRNDHAAAARYFEAAAKAVPEAAIGFRSACEHYELDGNVPKATDLCAAALTGQGAELTDYSHYARLVFAKKTDLAPKDVQNLDGVVAHLLEVPSAHSVAYDIQCMLGVRVGDDRRLSLCAPALAKMAPDNPKSLFYEWTLAMHHRDYTSAVALADRAMQRAALPREMEQARAMKKATLDALPLWKKGFGFRDWRVGAITAMLLAGVLAYLLTRKSAGAHPPKLEPPRG